MKIFPDANVSFYVDKPGCWGSYIKYDGNHSWKSPVKYSRPKNMYYWRDIEGAKMTKIQTENLYFQDFSTTRIRSQACLGMIYGTGFRFIKLAMAPPANFKCAPLPVNLAKAHEVNIMLAQKAKEKKLAKKKAKKARKAKKKAEKNYQNRAKKKGKK